MLSEFRTPMKQKQTQQTSGKEISEFADLGVEAVFCDALARANIHSPSPIQQRAIPPLLDGQDVLGIAQTGTGKTVAFGVPLLQSLRQQGGKPQKNHPKALILAPTRELAMQIGSELEKFAAHTKLTVAVIFGGVGQNPQIQKLRRGIDILVATPGRLLDLAQQDHVKLGMVKTLVLDEADRLLDMGFIRDVKKIVGMTPRKRQSLLFSATLPAEVVSLANSMLNDHVRIEVAPQQPTVKKIRQRVLHVQNPEKIDALQQLLHQKEVSKAIVFARTKHGAEKIGRKLNKAGISSAAIHGNKSQNARTRALDAFAENKVWVLVATDIAARGIDVKGVTHVVNHELPHEPESYVHRIGRTGRAGADGCAWSLVDSEEKKRLTAIERFIKMQVPVAEWTPDGFIDSEPPRLQKQQSTEQPKKKRRRRRRPRKAA